MIDRSDPPDEQDLQIRAFVLCGGLGTRLRPVLSDRPKSMAPVAGVPFLQLLLEDLKAQGIGEVILGTGYMADQVRGFFSPTVRISACESVIRGKTSRWAPEERSSLAEPLLSDPVVVLNGDSYVEWNLAATRDLFVQKRRIRGHDSASRARCRLDMGA